MKRTIMLVALLFIATLQSQAQNQGDWEFSLGASYRTINQIDFATLTLTRPDGNRFVAGSHTDAANFRIEGDPQLDLAGWTTVDPDGIPGNADDVHFRNVYFDQATLSGVDENDEPFWGVTLTASRPLNDWLKLDMGFAAFTGDTDTTARSGGDVSTTTYFGTLTQIGGAAPALGNPATPYEEAGGVLVVGGPNYDMTAGVFDTGGGGGTAAVKVDLDADAQLYVFSVGVSGELEVFDGFSLSLGVGPTVNVLDAETEYSQSATWDAPTNPLDGTAIAGFAKSESDDELAVEIGAYLAIGARVRLAENVGLGVYCRYDEVFGDPSTDHAEFDLSGFSYELQLTFRF